MKKVLVTGGSGFIGGHTIEELLEKGYEVVTLDLVPFEERSFRFDVNGNLTAVTGDIRDAELVKELISKVDVVIHLAGVLGTAETIDSLQETASVNVLGSINIFEECRKQDKRCVYITIGNDWQNPYTATKSLSKDIAFMLNSWRETKIVVVRGMNAYGERQKAYPVRKVFPAFALQALSGYDIEVYGNGNMIIDLTEVKDIAHGLVLAMEAPESRELYESILDFGTERKTTVLDLAKMVAKEVFPDDGPMSHIKSVDMRLGEPKNSVTLGKVASSAKFIDYKPSRTIEEFIPKTVKWYKDNFDKFDQEQIKKYLVGE